MEAQDVARSSNPRLRVHLRGYHKCHPLPSRLARVSPSKGELSILYRLMFGGRESPRAVCLRPEPVVDCRYAEFTRGSGSLAEVKPDLRDGLGEISPAMDAVKECIWFFVFLPDSSLRRAGGREERKSAHLCLFSSGEI
jgi:hypothetical protein